MSQPHHDPELNAVEAALAGLTPSAGGLNRDALMFAAGRRSAPRGWGWPCAAAGSALAAAVLGALLLFRPAPEPVIQVVPRPARSLPAPPPGFDVPPGVVDVPPPPQAPGSRSGDLPPEPDYLTLRHQAERWGDVSLPVPPAAADARPSDPLDDLPPGDRDDPWLQRRKAMLNPGGSL